MVYDFEDQLIQTRIGSNSSTPLQTVDFTYNEQGWLTGINPTQNGDLFTQSIAYQSPQNYAGIEYPDLAGNISQIMWQIDGLDEKAYNYKYDDLYRIVNADFLNTNGSSIDDYSTSYSCDSRGNISSLDRRGKFQNGSWVSGTIDSLEYDYLPGTNKIRQITDEAGPIVSCAQDITVNQNVSTGIFEASGTIYASGDVLSTDNVTMQAGSSVKMEAGFKASSNGGVFVAQSGTCSSILKEVNGFIESGLTTDYMYDENGNLEYDSDKEITIIYNHLNLPDTIKKASGDLIVFRYSATGMKLQRTTTIGTTSSTYDYINGIEYYNGEIEAVYGNGYRIVKIENGNGTVDWEYEYHISDHLGNTRVAFIDSSGFAVKTQVNDYYPFGMKMYNEQSIMKMSTNRYLYNNKELIGDLDIGLYDYGARFYDPSIGRFTGVDPIADQFPHVSVYNYAENEPIANIDLWGLQKFSVNPIGSIKSRAENLVQSQGIQLSDINSRDLKTHIPLQKRNLFKDVGNGMQAGGGAVSSLGLAISLFNPPTGGGVAAIGTAMQMMGTGLVAAGEYAESGDISNETIIEGGVDVAFAAMPQFIEAGLDNLQLDKGTKALANAIENKESFTQTKDYIMSIVNIGLAVAKKVVKEEVQKNNNLDGAPTFTPPDDVAGN